MILPLSFYQTEDTLLLSKQLLGKYLVTEIDGIKVSGMITETEGYLGPQDRASHAYNNRHTSRTKVMFCEGGCAYVYLCYGIHFLFNIVTHRQGVPQAILIRSIEPKEGLEVMMKRRHKKKADLNLSTGPGNVTQCLGINLSFQGTPLNTSKIFVEDRSHVVLEDNIIATSRVGVGYAKEYALKPWRFYIKDNLWVSAREKTR